MQDVRPAIAGANIYVLPSYREGTPRSVLEAMAMGRPVVTTDAPGCREVVSHEVDGLIVPVRDAAALAAAIVRVWADPALRLRLGRASREKVLRNYDDRIVIHKTMAVYRELLPE
jgi:glycosyltransferase involved in cell wall biosynthesis